MDDDGFEHPQSIIALGSGYAVSLMKAWVEAHGLAGKSEVGVIYNKDEIIIRPRKKPEKSEVRHDTVTPAETVSDAPTIIDTTA